MKEKILTIINQYPKRYSQIIKSDSVLLEWVNQNSLISSDILSEKIYSAVTQTSNQCPHNKTKSLKSFSQGWSFCGHSNSCICNAQHTGKKVSENKKTYSIETREKINQKRKSSMIEKYGCAYNSQRQDIHHIWTKPKIDNETFQLLNNKEWLQEEYVNKKRSLVDLADQLGVYYSTVGEYCRQHGFNIRQRSNYSLEETQISEFLNSLNISHIDGDWTILDRQELDIWIPSHSVAIELNGLYWHSYHPNQNVNENRRKHVEKSIACEKKNIDLLQITDWEWHNQRSIVENLIKSKLNQNQSIGARKCNAVEISNSQANTWFKQHHLQGATPAHKSYALVKDEQILLAISIGKSRFDKSSPYELLRMCGAPGVNVAGGLSKLMKFIKSQLDNSQIITYCDRSKSRSVGYQSAGFELVRATDPGYYWTDGTNVVSRYRAQKHQLEKWLPNYNPSLSESANMFAQKYRRYWDCGNWVLKF